MKAKKILFISQEITPYLTEGEKATIGRQLPQYAQEAGREIRTFMPKWGNINERRNQLHEVIRLSGMNLIIDDTDHPLVIKVASIQSARMQVYFIDNDDYFQGIGNTAYNDEGVREENDCRTIFYARGVLETVKKLRWCPEIIHCQGWISALAPLYIKTAYREEPSFMESKIVFSIFDDNLTQDLPADFAEKLLIRGTAPEDLTILGEPPYSYADLLKLALAYSDGVILHTENIPEPVKQYIRESGIPCIHYDTTNEDCQEKTLELYDQIWSKGKPEEES